MARPERKKGEAPESLNEVLNWNTHVLEDDKSDPWRLRKDRKRMLAKNEVSPPGTIPTMVRTEPGLQVTTIELPAMGEAKLWHNFLHQLQLSTGIVILRGLGQPIWDRDIYQHMQDMWAEIIEVPESRPMTIINMAKGDCRSVMMTLPGISNISLATEEATFGLPDMRIGANPAVITCALSKRIGQRDLKNLCLGQPIDAREAQRIGLVDFVGDVEAELARLIWKHCQPKTECWMWRPDLQKAWRKEDEGADGAQPSLDSGHDEE